MTKLLGYSYSGYGTTASSGEGCIKLSWKRSHRSNRLVKQGTILWPYSQFSLWLPHRCSISGGSEIIWFRITTTAKLWRSTWKSQPWSVHCTFCVHAWTLTAREHCVRVALDSNDTWKTVVADLPPFAVVAILWWTFKAFFLVQEEL